MHSPDGFNTTLDGRPVAVGSLRPPGAGPATAWGVELGCVRGRPRAASCGWEPAQRYSPRVRVSGPAFPTRLCPGCWPTDRCAGSVRKNGWWPPSSTGARGTCWLACCDYSHSGRRLTRGNRRLHRAVRATVHPPCGSRAAGSRPIASTTALGRYERGVQNQLGVDGQQHRRRAQVRSEPDGCRSRSAGLGYIYPDG